MMLGGSQTKRYRKEERTPSYSDILESLVSFCDDDSRPLANHYRNESSYIVDSPISQDNDYNSESRPLSQYNNYSGDSSPGHNNFYNGDSPGSLENIYSDKNCSCDSTITKKNVYNGSSVSPGNKYIDESPIIAGNLYLIGNSYRNSTGTTDDYNETVIPNGNIPESQSKQYTRNYNQNEESLSEKFNYRRSNSYNAVDRDDGNAKNVIKNNENDARNPSENSSDIYSRQYTTFGTQNGSVRNTSYSKSSTNINNVQDKDLLYRFRKRDLQNKEPTLGERSNTWSKLHQDPVESDSASYNSFPPPGELQRAPSQATMHHTTVPQAIVSRTLGSRHHPTRSSLRHSRMLVMVKNGTVPRKYLPGVVDRLGLGVGLYVTQVVIGSLLTGLGAWHLTKMSNAFRPEDLPFHSGIMALISGWVGLILLTCFRYYYPGSDHHTCLFPVRTYHIVVSLVVSVSSVLCCLISTLCHLFHLLTYQSSNCQVPSPPPGWPVNSCLCLSSWGWQSGQLIYPGTSCLRLAAILPPLLVTLLVLNLLAAAAGLASCLLLASTKHNQTFSAWRNGVPCQDKDGSLSPIIKRMRPRSASML